MLESLLGLQLYKKETPTRVFTCEYCEIFEKGFLNRTPTVAASVTSRTRFFFVADCNIIKASSDKEEKRLSCRKNE